MVGLIRVASEGQEGVTPRHEKGFRSGTKQLGQPACGGSLVGGAVAYLAA